MTAQWPQPARSQSFTAYQQQHPQQYSQHQGFAAQSNGAYPSSYPSDPQPAPLQHQAQPAPNSCYNCGSPDHWAQSCPEPRREVPVYVGRNRPLLLLKLIILTEVRYIVTTLHGPQSDRNQMPPLSPSIQSPLTCNRILHFNNIMAHPHTITLPILRIKDYIFLQLRYPRSHRLICSGNNQRTTRITPISINKEVTTNRAIAIRTLTRRQ